MVVIDDPGSEDRAEEQMGTAAEIIIGTVAAGEAIERRADHVHFSREPYFGELTRLAVIFFTDRRDNNWVTGRGTLELNPHPPRMC